MEEVDFKRELEINPHKLDQEWLRQPQQFQKYAELAADADKEAKRAEERLKVIRSELILEAANGNIPELGKATAQTIEAWYRTHPKHKKAKEALHEAEHTRDVLQGAVQAFRMRGNSLENLVKMHLSNYYTNPNPGINEAKAGEQAGEAAAENIRNRQRRNKA